MSRIVIPDLIRKRKAAWGPGDKPPRRDFAYCLKDEAGASVIGYADSTSRRTGIDEGAMSADFIISSEVPDRVGDVILTKGIGLNHFVKNPTCPYGHGALIWPIGRWKSPDSPAGTCTIRKGYPQRNVTSGTLFYSQGTPEGRQAFVLTLEECLSAVSVGFNPMAPPERRSYEDANPNSMEPGHLFPAVDLLECSLVMIPAHPAATRLRSMLDLGKIGDERIGPRMKALLTPFAEAKKAWAPGADVQGDTVSKKWKKRGKALNESSSAEGGAVVPEGEPAGEAAEDKLPEPTHDAGTEAMHKRIKEYTSAIMRHHMKDAEPPHDAYYHEERKAVFHHHHKDADHGHLALVKDDLENIEGVREVHQHHEPPDGEGWEKVYAKEAMGANETNEGAEEHSEEVAREKPQTEEELEKKPTAEETNVPARRASFQWTMEKRVAVGNAVKGLALTRKSELEDCVHDKIPKIAEDHPEMDDDQREAVAFSMCGEKLFGSAWLKTLAKAMEPEEELPMESGDEPATGEGAQAVEQQDEVANVPHGAESAQKLIACVEECLEMAEPETREFFAQVLGEVRDWASERYPDVPFGGEPEDVETDEEPAEGSAEEEADESPEEAEAEGDENLRAADHTPEENEHDRDETRAAAAEYRRLAPGSFFAKRYLHKRGLGVIKGAADHMEDMSDHFAEMADDEGEEHEKRRHARVVKAACSMHAKALAELHKEMSGADDDMGGGDGAAPPAPAAGPDYQTAGIDWSEIEARLNAVGRRVNGVSEAAYRLTGKRV